MKSARYLLAAALVLAGLQPANAAPTPTPSPSQSQSPTPTPIPSASATSTPSATATATPTPTPTPTPNKPHTCSIKAAMQSRDLAYFYGYVMNATTGQVYASVRGDELTPSASVMKVVTAQAAIQSLDRSYTATTRVYTVPSQPGVVVLRGGGDHTLSRLNPPSYTTYKYPPKISKLAALVNAAWPVDQPITKIILDASYFDKPSWNRAWKDSDRTNGYISLITGLMVDSDRRNPDLTDKNYSGYRSANPVLTAGGYFKTALGPNAKDAELIEGALPADAVEVGAVRSQPMSIWLDHALKYSDNTETEIIARHALRMNGMATDFASIQPMVIRYLKKLKIDYKKLVMFDASGLAQGDRVTAKLVASIMAKAADPTSPVADLLGYLPVSGVSGTLAGRYNGYSAQARGAVHAKSGYIPGLYSLAGVVYAKDGTAIAFAGFARSHAGKSVGYGARSALDALTTRLFLCGAGSYY